MNAAPPENPLAEALLRWDDALLASLLRDHARGRPIRWATPSLAALGKGFGQWDALTPRRVRRAVAIGALRPRAAKSAGERLARVRSHGEVFTPAWICKRMTDLADAPWLRKSGETATEDLFLHDVPPPTPIRFRKGRVWQDYVRLRRLEIACGEAPFLAARYDAATGEPIPWEARCGLLDRKLRALPACLNRRLWLTWALRAYAATYGYEFQGDNLFLARANLLLTFEEAHRARWGEAPTQEAMASVAETLAWNLWQMDGRTELPPGEAAEPEADLFAAAPEAHPCRLRVEGRKLTLQTVKGDKTMKFDFIIGNPPYQGETKGGNDTFAPPCTTSSSTAPTRFRIASR